MPLKWYIIHVYSGFEKKVREAILEQAGQKGMSDAFEEILVPMEEVIEVKRGKKVPSERKFFPGYVLVKMDLNDETWSLVRNIPKVTGFLGGSGRPQSIPETEALRIHQQIQEGTEHPKSTVLYTIGEQIRVADGPFASFNGTVEEVDDAKQRLTVSVSIFGRATPVDLEFGQVEKV